MSDFGLLINNTNITGEYKNYTYYGKTTIHPQQVDRRPNDLYFASFTLPENGALFFIDCGANSIGQYGRGNDTVQIVALNSHSLDVYFYTLGNHNLNASNYGLIIRDKNGVLNFDSRYKYLKLLGQLYPDDSELAISTQIIGKLMIMPVTIISFGPSGVHTTITLKYISNNTIKENIYTIQDGRYGFLTYGYKTGMYLAADIKI